MIESLDLNEHAGDEAEAVLPTGFGETTTGPLQGGSGGMLPRRLLMNVNSELWLGCGCPVTLDVSST